MKKHLLISMSILSSLMISCQSDDTANVEPAPDFSIVSDGNLQIISTYENGWINEAVKNDFSGNPEVAFGYHENGYVKYCKTYESSPQHYLFSEVLRDETNLPVSSVYYNPDGSTRMSIAYENGLIIVKTIFTEKATTIFQYKSGRLSVVEKYNKISEETTKMVYDLEADKRVLTITSSEGVIYSEDLPLVTQLGFGLSTEEDIMLSNYIKDEPLNENRLFTSFSSSIDWERKLNLLEVIPAPLVYNKLRFAADREIDIKLIGSGNVYRSMAEQYSFVEAKILLAKYEYADMEYSVYPSIETRQKIWTELDENLDEFTKVYGDEFNDKYVTGKFFVVVGTLRNLPSDLELRERIESFARKQAVHLVTGETLDLSVAEQEQLSRVFFELKVHAPSFDDADGIVIRSYEDFVAAQDIVNNAPNDIIQREFRTYESVAYKQ